jgi:hypothetical protein
MIVRPRYIVGVDLGQANDYSSVLVIRPDESKEPIYTLGHIERIPLDTRYPQVVRHVSALVEYLRMPVKLTNDFSIPNVTTVVDYTGVGRPVADMFIDAKIGGSLILVTITGGDSVTRGDRGEMRVPKRDLASVIQRLLQEHRLIIPASHPMASTLTTELTGFRVKINLRGHDSYGAGEDWRSAPHDDLVLGLALACWQAENRTVVRII